MLKVQTLTAGYGGKPIVKNVSFSLENGSITGILGANGSGKTTLLKALCGLLPHEGACLLDGRELSRLAPRELAKLVGYIPQRSGISIDISVLDVVLMGFNAQLPLLARPTTFMEAKAREALNLVGLADRAMENYLNLSQGQKQLCLVARTLVGSGALLVLDEPESALDIRHRHGLLHILRNWTGDSRACLLTLHDPSLALDGCDQLILLEQGQIAAILHPRTDSLTQMEQALSKIYGSVTLIRCADKTGKTHLVMLKEDTP